MLRRFLLIDAAGKRLFSAKAMVQMDEAVNKQLESDELNPKRHPGIVKMKNIEIPEWVKKGMIKIIADDQLKPLRTESKKLVAYLEKRHPPPEQTEISEKLSFVREMISRKLDTSKMTHEEIEEFWKRKSYKVKNYVKQRVYAWVPIEYTARKSLHYLLGRGVQDYAVLHQIFNEIHTNDKDFNPKTLFDFGSGVCSVTWAALQFWKNSLVQHYCVDCSSDMNNLAESILENNTSIKNVYFRQFLPASARISSDLVVCAYSLFEMPNAQARLDLILNLWMKTEKYLVIVEQGTNAGFKLVNEARDFIIEMSSQSLETKNPNPFHVFAPCPHDLICPRHVVDSTPCNFEVPYVSLSMGKNQKIEKERYSYVVFKKGERPEDDKQWPRIVRPTIVRKKHTRCQLCTADGKLEEIVLTASRHGKYAYRCAKYSDWGDKLPLQIVDTPNPANPE